MFSEYLGIIESVARLGENATKGGVQRMNSCMTVGQVERRLKALVADGYLISERVDYAGTGKVVYALTNRCQTNMLIVTKCVDAVIVAAESEN